MDSYGTITKYINIKKRKKKVWSSYLRRKIDLLKKVQKWTTTGPEVTELSHMEWREALV